MATTNQKLQIATAQIRKEFSDYRIKSDVQNVMEVELGNEFMLFGYIEETCEFHCSYLNMEDGSRKTIINTDLDVVIERVKAIK